MRRRMYFVLPDVPTAERTTNDLLLARIEERYIHCLGRRGTPMGKLHEANVLQKTDLSHGAQLGMIIGGGGGAVLGAMLAFVPLAGREPLPMVAVLVGLLGGARCGGSWHRTGDPRLSLVQPGLGGRTRRAICSLASACRSNRE